MFVILPETNIASESGCLEDDCFPFVDGDSWQMRCQLVSGSVSDTTRLQDVWNQNILGICDTSFQVLWKERPGKPSASAMRSWGNFRSEIFASILPDCKIRSNLEISEVGKLSSADSDFSRAVKWWASPILRRFGDVSLLEKVKFRGVFYWWFRVLKSRIIPSDCKCG